MSTILSGHKSSLPRLYYKWLYALSKQRNCDVLKNLSVLRAFEIVDWKISRPDRCYHFDVDK